MNEPNLDMSTDSAWEEWGRRDPYYGVITHPKFRRAAMTEEAKREFFGASQNHAEHALAVIRKHMHREFAPRRILDFGCGVGRLLVAFSNMAEEVIGVDVSPAMLEEAERNCAERHLTNVRLLLSDDSLSSINGTFDLIHSFIVFQHIPIARGRLILSNLLRRLRPGGVAAIHLTYAKTCFSDSYGVAPPQPPSAEIAGVPVAASADPPIQMNSYNMSEILFLMQRDGFHGCHLEFVDHGGELGVFMYISAPDRQD
jgi:SAM-dependent methyltransferase